MAKNEKDPLTTIIRSLFGMDNNSTTTTNNSGNSGGEQNQDNAQLSKENEYASINNKQKALSALLDRFVGAKPNYNPAGGNSSDYTTSYTGNSIMDQLDWLRGDSDSIDTSKPGKVEIEYKKDRDPWSKSQIEVGQQIVDMSNALSNGTYDESRYNKKLVEVVNDLADKVGKGEQVKESRASYDAFWKIVDDVYANSDGNNAFIADKLNAWSDYQNNKTPSGKSSWSSENANRTNTERIIENLYNDNAKKDGSSISQNSSTAGSGNTSSGNGTTESSDSADVITYTYKPGDTFGQVLLNLGLSDGTNLWGPGGDVEYYTQQLINQDMLDYRGNVKLGIPFKLRRRKK